MESAGDIFLKELYFKLNVKHVQAHQAHTQAIYVPSFNMSNLRRFLQW